MSRLSRLVVLAALAGALLAPASSSASSMCSSSGPAVCVDVSHTPGSVPVAAGGTQSYISFTVTVRNTGTSSATHAVLRDTVPDGVSIVAPVPGCTVAGGVLTCDLGRLAGGATRIVSFSTTAPATPGTIVNSATVSYDERASDGPTADPKQDAVTATEAVAIVLPSGEAETWVPAGVGATLTTGVGDVTATQPQIGSVTVPAPPVGLVARLATSDAPPFTCPAKLICRSGEWIEASVPGLFTDPPLTFRLRWDAALVSKKQTTKNFAVFYKQTLDAPLEVIDDRCRSATPAPAQQPCLWDVRKEDDGDWSAVLIQDHNGYMR